MALLAAGAAARCRHLQRAARSQAVRGGASAVTRAAVESEASRLERQAAQLRAEAQELEKAKAVERRAARAEELLDATRDSGATVGPEALSASVKKVVGLTLSPNDVRELMAVSATGDRLGFDDLASVAFDAALEKLVAAQDAKLSAELAERQKELAAEAEREKMVSSVTSLFSGDADDGGPTGRALACLPYLLPLLDGLPYGLSLASFVPFLAPLFITLGPLLGLKNAIPFGTFIFLLGFQFLCRNQELPGLLRYNLRQACVIDVLILLPSFVAGFTGFRIPDTLDIPIFILMAICIGYSLVCTALGKTPSGLGFVSDATERGLWKGRGVAPRAGAAPCKTTQVRKEEKKMA
eukprot:CAMPEP_0175680862 /NCGR_PEP_ID=MMETSP0097-20121207/25007_1 /TAXON_ID=311494 /ORGANISM="Alexandrium monilatum, Strain CCMP3105" /LENGTH=352 /DNA_ID=CAMNT_0016987707 /DNA_START=17 /DNA_END=1072 /DNA_ORIENTATION=-